MFKFVILIPLFVFLSGCNTTVTPSAPTKNSTISQTEKNTKLQQASLKKQRENTEKYASINWDGLTKVELSKNTKLLKVKIKNNLNWQTIDVVQKDGAYFFEPGQYRIQVKPEGLVSDFIKLNADIAPETKNAFIHSTISPDAGYIHTWYSTYPVGSDEYKFERAKQFCASILDNRFSYKEVSAYVVSSCQALEKQADDEVFFYLGYMHLKGLGIKKDTYKAIDFLKHSFELGYLDAGLLLSDIYRDQKMQTPHEEIIEQLANKNDPYAMYVNAFNTLKNTKTPQELNKAKKLALKSAQLGNLSALEVLARTELLGDILNPNHQAAYTWWQIILQNTNSIRYPSTDIYNSIEMELNAEQKQLAMQNIGIYREKLGERFSGKLHIAPLFNTPMYSSSTLQIKLNSRPDFLTVPTDKAYSLSGLVINNLEHRIEFYVNNEIVSVDNFSFEQHEASELCFHYNEDKAQYMFLPLYETNACDIQPAS